MTRIIFQFTYHSADGVRKTQTASDEVSVDYLQLARDYLKRKRISEQDLIANQTAD